MLTNEEFETKMMARRMNIDGAEMPDPRPMAPPVGYNRQPSMWETVKKMMAAEFAARHAGEETPEDAADMGDDEEDVVEALSQYERYDLEMELARRTDLERQEASRRAAAEPPSDGPGAGKTPGQAPQGPDGGSKSVPPVVAPAADQ